jgi:hypothetical protein
MEKTPGEAECKNGHKWTCTWWLNETPMRGGMVRMDRIVDPPHCPQCKRKWESVKSKK